MGSISGECGRSPRSAPIDLFRCGCAVPEGVPDRTNTGTEDLGPGDCGKFMELLRLRAAITTVRLMMFGRMLYEECGRFNARLRSFARCFTATAAGNMKHRTNMNITRGIQQSCHRQYPPELCSFIPPRRKAARSEGPLNGRSNPLPESDPGTC